MEQRLSTQFPSPVRRHIDPLQASMKSLSLMVLFSPIASGPGLTYDRHSQRVTSEYRRSSSFTSGRTESPESGRYELNLRKNWHNHREVSYKRTSGHNGAWWVLEAQYS